MALVEFMKISSMARTIECPQKYNKHSLASPPRSFGSGIIESSCIQLREGEGYEIDNDEENKDSDGNGDGDGWPEFRMPGDGRQRDRDLYAHKQNGTMKNLDMNDNNRNKVIHLSQIVCFASEHNLKNILFV